MSHRLIPISFALCTLLAGTAAARQPLDVAVISERNVPKGALKSLSQAVAEEFHIARVKYNPRKGVVAQIKGWGRTLDIDRVVVLSVQRRGNTSRLRAVVFDAQTGKTLGRFPLAKGVTRKRKARFDAGALRRAGETLVAALTNPEATNQAIAAKPEPEPDPEPESPPSDGAAEAPPAGEEVAANPSEPPGGSLALQGELWPEEKSGLSSRFSIGVTAGLVGRSFSFNEFLVGGLREHDQEGAGLVQLDASYRILQKLSVEASVATTVSSNQSIEDLEDTEVGASWLDASGGLVYTAIGSLNNGFALELGALLRSESFSFDDLEGDLSNTFPDVSYLSTQGDVRLRYSSRSFDVRFSAGMLYVLSVGGTISDAFPNASALGAEARTRATYPVTDWLDVGVAASYRRYGLSFDPEIGAEFVAGGATDEYWQAGGIIGFTL